MAGARTTVKPDRYAWIALSFDPFQGARGALWLVSGKDNRYR